MRPVEIGSGEHVFVPTYKLGRCTVSQVEEMEEESAEAAAESVRRRVVVSRGRGGIMDCVLGVERVEKSLCSARNF